MCLSTHLQSSSRHTLLQLNINGVQEALSCYSQSTPIKHSIMHSGSFPHLAFPLLGVLSVLCDSWMLRDLLQKDLTLLQQEGLNDGEAALQDWLLSSSLYLSPVTSLALHSWRKKKAARWAGKSVRPAGVHPRSFPPALTCYPSKLAVFGLWGKVGIRDLIQIWSSKLLPERKQASRTVTVQPLNFKLLLLSTCTVQNFTFFCFRLCFHEVSLIDYFPLEAVIIMISEGKDLLSRSPLYLLCINWRDHQVAYLSGTTNKENFGFKNVLDCVF